MSSPVTRVARHLRGLSLIELLIALGIVSVLAALAYPGFQSAVLKARRGEALAGLAQLQMAQERHRSNHRSYASLSQLGIAATSPGGRYRYSEEAPTATGFSVTASAQGGQAADLPCRHLGLQVDGLETRRASGPDTSLGNNDSTNRRCWGD